MNRRIHGLDVGRGVASLIMIQGHAYHGWVAPEFQATAAYAFTRVLGTFPLPAFFVLAGASIALRSFIARQREEVASMVRRSVLRRGLRVVLWGYLASLLYAAMDGTSGLSHLLRADVLHAIGLSIALLSWLSIREQKGSLVPSTIVLRRRALLLAFCATAVAPFAARSTSELGGSPLGYVVALFSQVDGITRMPLVPLVAWSAVGAIAMSLSMDNDGRIDRLRVALCTVISLVLLGFGVVLTSVLMEPGAPFDRTHEAIWGNVVDLGGRGLLMLGVGFLLTPYLPARIRSLLTTVGRNSLFIYVVHIPFCYGLLGAPLRGKLNMAEATCALAVLLVLCAALAWVKERIQTARPSYSRALVFRWSRGGSNP